MGENNEQVVIELRKRKDALRPEDATNNLNLRTKNITHWSALSSQILSSVAMSVSKKEKPLHSLCVTPLVIGLPNLTFRLGLQEQPQERLKRKRASQHWPSVHVKDCRIPDS